jgi:hypothetical protein
MSINFNYARLSIFSNDIQARALAELLQRDIQIVQASFVHLVQQQIDRINNQSDLHFFNEYQQAIDHNSESTGLIE